MKPIIGIFPCYEEEKNQTFLKNTYTDEIIKSGGIPLILPLSVNPKIISEILSGLDGIIFSGGADIAPEYYGEKNEGKSLEISYLLDESEKEYIRLSLEKDMPVLGICRGMQALNVFCGGSLYQDIPSEISEPLIHSLEKPDVAFHEIKIEKSSPLSEIAGFGKHVVNSYHHQSVRECASDFSVAATSEDGVVEAIYHKEKKFVLGVQWHPERDHETALINKPIFEAFVEICYHKN